ncbi:MAG: archaellin/type IV pilin N-terminal domain-containing protein [Candidatus Nanoarchaeia archaeon]|jgi:flagellin-like protein
MKSITPIVSVILLVLITIVASVSAFFFINSNVLDLESQGNLDNYPGADNSRLNLVSVTGTKAIVRNDGSSPVTEIVVFINGELFNYTLDSPLMPGELREINYTAQLAGEDLEIKVIYNTGKTVQQISPAKKNTADSGFAENPLSELPIQSYEGDSNSTYCLLNNSNNTWFTGSVSESNGPCCGDDLLIDTFKNDTDFCINGNLTMNASLSCGDGICQVWESAFNCSNDCTTYFTSFEELDEQTVQGINWEQYVDTYLTPLSSHWKATCMDDQGIAKITGSYGGVDPYFGTKMGYTEANPVDNGWTYGCLMTNLSIYDTSNISLNLKFAWFVDQLFWGGNSRIQTDWWFYYDTNNDSVFAGPDEIIWVILNDSYYDIQAEKTNSTAYPLDNSIIPTDGSWNDIRLNLSDLFLNKYGHFPVSTTGLMLFEFCARKYCTSCGDTGYSYNYYDNVTISWNND